MSAPVALSAPRVFRLPRVRFKRPRWPRGNRLYLVCAAINLATLLIDAVTGAWGWAGVATVLVVWCGYRWWRSRDDDDGPSAT
jgi:hypothetical protein